MSANVTHNAASLSFETQFDARIGQAVALDDGLTRVCAPNASPYTFTGTNCFLIGKRNLFIVDPGPDDTTHLKNLLRAVDGRSVQAILLTHTHNDHSALAPKLSEALGGVPIWFGGAHRLSRPRKMFEINVLAKSCDWKLRPDKILRDGDVLKVDGLRLRVIETAGHCANHLAFGLENTDHVLSGDHVMGWNSTLIGVPDGSLGAYFKSLDRLLAEPFGTFHPAHGGPIANGKKHALALKDHRLARNEQILDLVKTERVKFGDVVDSIYPNVPRATRRAASMVMHAHAEYLDELKLLKLGVNLLGQPRWIGPISR